MRILDLALLKLVIHNLKTEESAGEWSQSANGSEQLRKLLFPKPPTGSRISIQAVINDNF